MTIEASTLVGGALGGAVVQSVLGALVGQRHERRNMRAEVLRRIGELEQARWMDENGPSWQDYRSADNAVRAAGLVASAPRELIDVYLRFARAGRLMSERHWKMDPDPEFGGSVPGPLGDLITDAAERLVSHVWYPHRRRLRLRHDLKSLEAQKKGCREDVPEELWEQ